MMKEEFEALAGYEVSWEDYDNIIEPMYGVTELSKQEFVKCIDKKRFALKTEKELVKEMKKIAKHLFETCENHTDFEARDKLDALFEEYKTRFWGSSWGYIETTTRWPNGQGCSFPKVVKIFFDRRLVKEIELVA